MKRTLHLTRNGPWASTYGIMTSSPDKHDSGAGMSSPAAEDALLKAWKGGDAAALGDLLSCFQPRIWSLCYRTLGRYEDAADLAQESMVKVIQGLRGFDGRSKLSTWIIRVTINCCLSHLRKEKLRRHQSLDAPAPGEDGGTRADHLLGREPQPEMGVERKDMLRQLSAAFMDIEGQQRLLLVLRDVQGIEYGQLAEIYEVPVGTIKSRLFRAREALRSSIEAQPGTDEVTEGHGPPAVRNKA